jgi:hypothetical protein
MAISKIKTGSITDSAIDTNKLAENSVTSSNFSTTVITGQTELSESAAGTDVILIYDTSSGTLKKIQASNVGLQAPTLSSISPTSVLTGDGTGNFTFTFTGTGFIATAVPTLITDGGSTVSFDSFTINSNTQITAVIAKSSLTNANEPYDVRVTVANALTATLTNQINIDAQPIFNTASGSLGSFSEQTAISTIDIEATDPESAGNVTFEIITGSLPAGLSTATVNENGVSKFRITGTLSTDVASLTTSNFTVRAADAASNTSTRAFSITEIPSGVESFTSSGTFSVPSGITSVDVLVVGAGGAGGTHHGGGGGAGGLVFVPGFPVTPGGTVSVTVGCGGGQPNNYPAPDNTLGQAGAPGQDSIFSTLTAKGGGGGGAALSSGRDGLPGGSGGGAAAPTGGSSGGSATQPTQPGQSGAYGFGNAGGPVATGCGSGGGGGAGAGGGCGTGSTGGPGGNGKSYTIADGTTPVFYAGGGGGAGHPTTMPAGSGGQGGGGTGGAQNEDNFPARPGTANRGGGGGGSDRGPGPTGAGGGGGKGIVIVSY